MTTKATQALEGVGHGFAAKFAGVGEVALTLGLSRTSVQKMVDFGALSAIKTRGGHRRVLRNSLEEAAQRMTIVTSSSQGRQQGHPDRFEVLIVERDPVAARILAIVCKRLHSKVKCTVMTDAFDAVLQIERVRPSVVIVDISVGDADMLRIIQMIKVKSEYRAITAISLVNPSESQAEADLEKTSLVSFERSKAGLERLRGFLEAYFYMHLQKIERH